MIGFLSDGYGDTPPPRPAIRVPYAIRHEVLGQLSQNQRPPILGIGKNYRPGAAALCKKCQEPTDCRGAAAEVASGIERVAGRRSSGSWDTQKWLIGKELAHVEDETLIADTQEAREVLDSLGSAPRHISGDRFKAAPRPNVPESEKPTAAQTLAQQANTKKAQAARRSRH